MSVDFNNLPRHIAIIMDGHGRWAKKRLLTKKMGHNAGASAIQSLSEEMDKAGFKIFTVYAASTENWKRSQGEIDDLMGILRDYIKREIKTADKRNMRMDVIGDITRLANDIVSDIEKLKLITAEKTGLHVNIAINYGSRDEIARAVRKQLTQGISADKITEDVISRNLDTRDLPDPDIIIRTGGESRLSNFLLWQAAYSELFFVDKLWPDFGMPDLLEIVEAFQNKERRFGGRV